MHPSTIPQMARKRADIEEKIRAKKKEMQAAEKELKMEATNENPKRKAQATMNRSCTIYVSSVGGVRKQQVQLIICLRFS